MKTINIKVNDETTRLQALKSENERLQALHLRMVLLGTNYLARTNVRAGARTEDGGRTQPVRVLGRSYINEIHAWAWEALAMAEEQKSQWTGKNGASYETWALIVAKHYFAGKLRAEATNPANSLRMGNSSIQEEGDPEAEEPGLQKYRGLAYGLPDPKPTPDLQAAARERNLMIRGRVAAALDKLPEKQRELVEVFYLLPALDGHTPPTREEVAKSMGISPGTLSSRLHYAKRILQGELASLLEE